MNAFAKALEIIPRQLCDNAGLDATDILNRLRQQHASKDPQAHNYGVDVNTGNQNLFQFHFLCLSGRSWHKLSSTACSFALIPNPLPWQACASGLFVSLFGH